MAGPASDYRRMISSLKPDFLIDQLEKDKKGTVAAGFKFLALGFLALLVASLIEIPISTYLSGSGIPYSTTQLLGLAAIVSMMVLITISISIMFLFARILGGVGSFPLHFYHLSILIGGLLTIAALLNLLPVIGFLLSIAAVFYSAYLFFLVYTRLHKLGTKRAIFLAIFPVIAALLFLMLFIIAFTIIIAAIAGKTY